MELYINLYNQVNELLEKLQSKKFVERKKHEYFENNINKKEKKLKKLMKKFKM